MKLTGALVLLLSLLLAVSPANAVASPRYQPLHQALRAQGELIPEVEQASPVDQDQMLCLALNIYHEIRGGSPRGQWAVGFVTMNRLKKEAFHAKTVCDVVWAPGQFSWTRWSKRAQIPHEETVWKEDQKKAVLLITGEKTDDPTHGSTYFYQARRHPYWANRLIDKIRIGLHMFGKRHRH